MADRVGQQLGNYRLVRLIGRGSFAEVYLGEHLHLNTQAAIKVLHAHLTSEDSERLRTEARTLARLMHPHIVQVLDFNVEDGISFSGHAVCPQWYVASTLPERHTGALRRHCIVHQASSRGITLYPSAKVDPSRCQAGEHAARPAE